PFLQGVRPLFCRTLNRYRTSVAGNARLKEITEGRSETFSTPRPPAVGTTMQSEPNTLQAPFRIDVADRVKRLPPYLFGKINELKYRKRRAGVDVIDLGMGNPTDVPEPLVVEKLCEAARDERNHRYSVSNGLFNLRREFALRYARKHDVQLDPETEILAGLG